MEISGARSRCCAAGGAPAAVGTDVAGERGAGSATKREVSLRTSSSSILRTSGRGSRMVASSSGLWSVTAGSGAPVCCTIPSAKRGTTGCNIEAQMRATLTASVSSRRAPSGSVASIFHGCLRWSRSFAAAESAGRAVPYGQAVAEVRDWLSRS